MSETAVFKTSLDGLIKDVNGAAPTVDDTESYQRTHDLVLGVIDSIRAKLTDSGWDFSSWKIKAIPQLASFGVGLQGKLSELRNTDVQDQRTADLLTQLNEFLNANQIPELPYANMSLPGTGGKTVAELVSEAMALTQTKMMAKVDAYNPGMSDQTLSAQTAADLAHDSEPQSDQKALAKMTEEELAGHAHSIVTHLQQILERLKLSSTQLMPESAGGNISDIDFKKYRTTLVEVQNQVSQLSTSFTTIESSATNYADEIQARLSKLEKAIHTHDQQRQLFETCISTLNEGAYPEYDTDLAKQLQLSDEQMQAWQQAYQGQEAAKQSNVSWLRSAGWNVMAGTVNTVTFGYANLTTDTKLQKELSDKITEHRNNVAANGKKLSVQQSRLTQFQLESDQFIEDIAEAKSDSADLSNRLLQLDQKLNAIQNNEQQRQRLLEDLEAKQQEIQYYIKRANSKIGKIKAFFSGNKITRERELGLARKLVGDLKELKQEVTIEDANSLHVTSQREKFVEHIKQAEQVNENIKQCRSKLAKRLGVFSQSRFAKIIEGPEPKLDTPKKSTPTLTA